MAQRLQTQDPMDWNQNVFSKRQPDGSLAYTDRLSALKNMPDEPGRAAAIEIEASARRKNMERMGQRLQDYKDRNAGMSPRQVRRERQQTQREDNRMRKAVMRGMNPMSPQATAMFPEAAGRFQQNMQKQKSGGMQNPIAGAAATKFGSGSARPTVGQREAAAGFLREQASGVDAMGKPVPRSPMLEIGRAHV
jgi:hypothetical protein